MKSGLIFDINEFAVHDGPGIRTSVFLKGCPLRCLWCHNPEGQSFAQELMAGNNGCLACGRCKAVCNHKSCIACGACIQACPRNLRRFAATEWTSADLAARLLRNRDILEAGNGGVTFSGGEPLAQAEFLFDVISRIKPLHVAIETSGFAPKTVFSRALDVCDLILMDIKHMDSEIHKKYTSFGNEQIQQNLSLLLESKKPCILRIPLIPGVNDDEKNLIATAERIRGYTGVIRLELLTYHKTAGAKYKLLNRNYEYELPYPPRDPHMFIPIFKDRDIPVFIP